MKRQGDLLIQEITEIPQGVKHIIDGVVLHGEATGHAHRLLDGEVLKKGDAIFLKVGKKATLVHEEHKPITLEKGLYSIIRQREYLTKDMTALVKD